MNLHHILSLVTMASLAACQSTQPEIKPGFSWLSFGEDRPMTSFTPQPPGTVTAGPITKDTFQEITIAQGSGFMGFDTVRIFRDGSGYVVIGDFESQSGSLPGGAKIPISLDAAAFDALLRAIQLDKAHQLHAIYTSELNDGCQAFIELRSTNGCTRSWLDNYFRPVRNLYAWANQHVFPKITSMQPSPKLRKNYDLQEEYHRVFPKTRHL
jgi:hypothetical protein